MGRNSDLVCYYCGNQPVFRECVGVYGFGVRAPLYVPLCCPRCGVGEYIPDHGRVVTVVTA